VLKVPASPADPGKGEVIPDPGRRLWGYVRRHLRQVVIAFLCMVLEGALGPGLILKAKPLLSAMLYPGGDLRPLTLAAGVLLGLLVVRGLCYYGHIYFSNWVGQQVIVALRRDIFSHLRHLSLSFFEDRRTGQLMSHLTNDIYTIQTVLTIGVSEAVIAPIAILAALGGMFSLSWRMTLVVLVGAPFIGWAIAQAGRRMRRIQARIQSCLDDMSALMQEAFSAIRILQCFDTAGREEARFQKMNEDSARAVLRGVRVQAALPPLVEWIGGLGLLGVLWFSGRSILLSSPTDTAGLKVDGLIIFLGLVYNTINQFRKLGRINLTFNSALAAAERIFSLLDLRSEVEERPGAIPLPEGPGHIRFESVSFAYRDGREVLRDVDFEIRPGEVVAVVGESGAGKSSLANLIPRLYDVTRGAVRVDGYDVRDLTLRSLRESIGMVPQEIILFSGTIRDNIAFGRPEATDAEIEATARAAHAHDFIMSFPDGYNTLVGERGRTLSGGQCQRLALARALLRNPKVLILDEATSSLDAESEAQVQEALETLMHQRTTLVIAHRLSTVQKADRILVLEQGRVVEEGRHEELLQRGGTYSRLYALQVGAEPAKPKEAPA
jgi:subfamily B ATP-binding cassette protein MsbA